MTPFASARAVQARVSAVTGPLPGRLRGRKRLSSPVCETIGAPLSVPPDTPLSYIEGIGGRVEARLQELNLFFVFDLIRASAEQIHSALKDTHSVEQVRRWRAMALLLQVDAVDGQAAEALVRADVSSIEKLKDATRAELQQLFADAEQQGMIPTVPSDDDLVAMLLDATRIHFTGGLNATVRDTDGRPVAGARVRIGLVRVTTDVRGRFRVLRVPLGARQRLVIEHDEFRAHTVENPPLTANNDLIRTEIYTVERVPAGAGAPRERLSEYDGDVLPPMSEIGMTSRQLTRADVRDRDLLVLHELAANGRDAQLVSKYRDYEGGRYLALKYRVPVADLPAGAAPRDAFLYRGGTFVPIKLTPSKLRTFRALRRAHKAFAGRPAPSTEMERDARRAEIAAFLRDNR